MTKRSILIVDDDRELVDLLSLRCRQLGLAIRVAYDVYSAMGLLDDALPDLVCLDVNLPSGNGLSICEMMATDPVAAKIPVIVLTGSKDSLTIRRCRDMCAYYVNKSGDVWRRVEPVIYELIDIEPAARASTKERQNR